MLWHCSDGIDSVLFYGYTQAGSRFKCDKDVKIGSLKKTVEICKCSNGDTLLGVVGS